MDIWIVSAFTIFENIHIVHVFWWTCMSTYFWAWLHTSRVESLGHKLWEVQLQRILSNTFSMWLYRIMFLPEIRKIFSYSKSLPTWYFHCSPVLPLSLPSFRPSISFSLTLYLSLSFQNCFGSIAILICVCLITYEFEYLFVRFCHLKKYPLLFSCWLVRVLHIL